MNSTPFDFSDSEILEQLSQDSEKAFELIFTKYHVELFWYVMKYVRLKAVAEEIVHDVLLYIWEHRHHLIIAKSLKSYLFTAAKHKSLDYLKSSYAKQSYQDDFPEGLKAEVSPDSLLEQEELKKLIQAGIEQLPERCRLIYRLSRTNGLPYKEIASHLNISPKTVEAQMGIALQRLRNYLTKYFEVFLWFPLSLIFC